MQKLRNQIICGDCIEVLGKVKEPFADLIFADPPFNIGYKYDKYYDKVKSRNYIAWTREWIKACKSVLRPHGSFYIAIGDDYVAFFGDGSTEEVTGRWRVVWTEEETSSARIVTVEGPVFEFGTTVYLDRKMR